MSGITDARLAFPVLQELTYLNTGTMGIMAQPVVRQYVPLLEAFEARGLAMEPEARRWAETARERLAAVLHVSADEITLTGNATDGVNLAAASLDWHSGDEVLISDQEHPAMAFPYLYAQQLGRLAVRRFSVSPDPDETLASASAALVPGRTKLLSFSHVTSQTGTRLPARALADAAHAAGALCFLDATQSFGQLAPSDLELPALGADFATSNGHKWLGAGKGTGFFWVRRDLIERLHPAHVGAGALRVHDALPGAPDSGTRGRLDLLPTARRFEFGTRNWMLAASIPLALDWLESVGWESIVAQEQRLTAALRAVLQTRPGIRQLTPDTWLHSSAMTTFVVERANCLDLGRHLWESARIRVRTVPELNALRVSTAYYNSQHDVDLLLDALARFDANGR